MNQEREQIARIILGPNSSWNFEQAKTWDLTAWTHYPEITRALAKADAILALRSGGEGWRPEEGSGYATGFKAGVLEAARTLSEAAEVHRLAAQDSRKVVEINGHKFAECLLASWANGLEINASRALPAPSPSTHGEG